MTALSQLLPDTTTLFAQRDSARSGMAGLVGALGALQRGGAESPIGAVVGVLGQVRGRLDIDVSRLTEQLPDAIQTIQNALPASVVEFIESIDQQYQQAHAFLADSPLADAAGSDDLQQAALAVIDDALALFRARLGELAGGIVGAEKLAEIADVLAAFERFRSDFPAHRDEFLPFLSRYLIGVAPDLLRQPLDQLAIVEDALGLAGTATFDAAIAASRQAADQAYADLLAAIGALDPAQAAGYTRIIGALDVLDAATGALIDTALPLYAGAQAVVENPAWHAALEAYQAALEAVPLEQIPSIDDVVDTIDSALGDLLARLLMSLGPEEIRGRLEQLNRAVRDTFLTSPLGQVRRTLLGFLNDIRDAIARIPTEIIQQTIEQMLGRVRSELEQLGIDRLGDQIADAFEQARAFIVENLNMQVIDRVKDALRGLADQARNLPVADLVANLDGAITQLQGAITQIEQMVGDQVEALKGLLAQLDTLSFEPISNEVIGEITSVKNRLQAINPNALSDVEKLALRGALAVLDAIDLKGQISDQLKPAYHSVEADVKRLLDDITAALHQFLDQIGILSPDTLLGPIHDLLGQVAGALSGLSGRAATAPLQRLADEAIAELDKLSPAQLLDPLQEPYAAMMRMVDQIDPERWLAPLNALYAEIDKLIDKVDLVPLMESLDQQRALLFAEARDAMLSGIDGLDLPAPLDAFLAELRPLIGGLADALFGDPAAAVPQVAANLRGRYRLTSLFAPLDLAFDQLLQLLDQIPHDDLVTTLEALRQGLGFGLSQLDPADLPGRFRAMRAALAERAPERLLTGALSLPALRASFQAWVELAPDSQRAAIVAVQARFDLAIQVVVPGAPASRIAPLTQAHNALLVSLDQRAASLDVAGASAAYRRLRAGLDRLLPDFLRQPQPLSYDDVMAGIATLRPSTRAARLDATLEHFLDRVQPLVDQIADLTNGFFGALRDAVQLVNPLTLRDSVAEIYDAIRAKVRVIDPLALAAAIRTDILEPIMAPLRAIDPAAIKARLQALYDAALAALRDGARQILDQVAAALDDLLRQIRAQVKALIGQIEATITQALHAIEQVIDQIEGLVFVEILGRLRRLIDQLGISFDQELDRVLSAFDQMLHAIPLGGSVSAGVAA
jgi:hypothetical protein